MRRLRGDRGSTALFVAVFAPAMLFMAGLVIDGGSALESRQRAADIAEQAARAGANQCNVALLRSAGECRITDFREVDRAVSAYRKTDGVTTLDYEPLDPVPGTTNQYYGVRVTVVIRFDTVLLGIVPKFKTLTISETADAVAVTRL